MTLVATVGEALQKLKAILAGAELAVRATTVLLGIALLFALTWNAADLLLIAALSHFFAVSALLAHQLMSDAPVESLGDPTLYTRIGATLGKTEPEALRLLVEAMQTDNQYPGELPSRKARTAADNVPPARKFILPAESEPPQKSSHWPTLFPNEARRQVRRAFFRAAGHVAKEIAPTRFGTVILAVVSLGVAAFLVLCVAPTTAVSYAAHIDRPASVGLVVLDQISKGIFLDILEFGSLSPFDLGYKINYANYFSATLLFALRTLPSVAAATAIKHWKIRTTLRDLIVTLTSDREAVIQLRWGTLDATAKQSG